MVRRLLVVAAAAVLSAACGSGGSDGATSGPAPTTSSPAATVSTTAPPPRSLVATATVPSVSVYDSPGLPEAARSLEHPTQHGTPLVFLVVEQQPEWLKVMLPVRPNGSTGWVRASDVSLASHDFRILAEVSEHRLTVWKGHEVFAQEPVGVGRGSTPTPGGLFYTTGLVKPVEPRDVQAYGPFAYPLSGFSEVLTSFMGGNGELAIHGTGDPSSVGQDVSFGCIRMTNEAITRLANSLPVGVPVEIRP